MSEWLYLLDHVTFLDREERRSEWVLRIPRVVAALARRAGLGSFISWEAVHEVEAPTRLRWKSLSGFPNAGEMGFEPTEGGERERATARLPTLPRVEPRSIVLSAPGRRRHSGDAADDVHAARLCRAARGERAGPALNALHGAPHDGAVSRRDRGRGGGAGRGADAAGCVGGCVGGGGAAARRGAVELRVGRARSAVPARPRHLTRSLFCSLVVRRRRFPQTTDGAARQVGRRVFCWLNI
eukprot:6433360-Prymnesium_polylepis.1